MRILLLILALSFIQAAHACSCWERFLSEEEKVKDIYFIAKALETKEFDTYSLTKYLVVDGQNSAFRIGEEVRVKQANNYCHKPIDSGVVYKLLYFPQGEYLRGSFCTIKEYVPTKE